MKKKFSSLLLFAFVVLVMPFVINAKSVIQTITEGTESNYSIDANYGWTFNTKNTTATASSYNLIKSGEDARNKKIMFKEDEDYSLRKYYYLNSETDCSSGKIFIQYNNVGLYQGKKVNLRVTLTKCTFGRDGQGGMTLKNYKYNNNWVRSEKPSVGFDTTSMQVLIDGLRSTDLKYEFLNENGEKINLKGYGTFRDLDFSQAFKMGAGVDKAFIYGTYSRVCTQVTDSQCSTWGENIQHLLPDKLTTESDYTQTVNSENTIQSLNYETFSGREYKYAWATILFSGGEFNLTYYLGEPDFLKSWWQNSTNNPNNKEYEGFGGGMFRFDPDSLVPFKVEDPVKSVNKSSVNIGEEFTYTTSHRVPYINKDGSGNKYTAYSFSDTLEPCLTTTKNDVIIMNDEALDVTNKFDIKVTESNGSYIVTADAKSDFIDDTANDDVFYGHEYEFIITARIKDNYDLTKYLNNDKSGYVIPNKASISVTDNSGISNKTTNIVNVIVPIPKEVVPAPDTGKYISMTITIVGSLILVGSVVIISLYLNNKKKKNN